MDGVNFTFLARSLNEIPCIFSSCRLCMYVLLCTSLLLISVTCMGYLTPLATVCGLRLGLSDVCLGVMTYRYYILCTIIFDARDNFFLLLQIFDPNRQRFEVIPEGIQPESAEFKKASHTAYDFEYRERPFSLRVIRKSTGYVL